MKTALPWVLVAALLAGGYFLYSKGRDKDAELDRLRQDNQELAALRADNEKLKGQPDTTAELERLRKDNEELLRLRGEVTQLRKQALQFSNQLQTAVAQSSRVQQQQQQTAAEIQSLRTAAQQSQQAKAQADALVCINNLRQIDGAKQMWVLENKKGPGSIPTVSDIAPYLPNNTMPACPAGGTYSLNPLTA